MVAQKEIMDADLNMAAICLYLFHGHGGLWFFLKKFVEDYGFGQGEHYQQSKDLSMFSGGA